MKIQLISLIIALIIALCIISICAFCYGVYSSFLTHWTEPLQHLLV